MGRGRAKAKQTKVARQLKYNSAPEWDPSRLEADLRGSSQSESNEQFDEFESDEYDDPYAVDDGDTRAPRH